MALDELWRELEDIYPLLRLLIPFEDFIDEYGDDVLYQVVGVRGFSQKYRLC